MNRTSRRLMAALAPILLVIASCSGSDEGTTASAPKDSPDQATHADHEGSSHHDSGSSHDDSGSSQDGHHSGHHADASALTGALLTAGDLPAGYTEGHGHHQPSTDGPAPANAPACTPIGHLVGDHPGLRQSEHPEARAAFTKSHFGPNVSETIIDYGSAAAAREAFRSVVAAGETCDRYTQSLAPTGATTYTVQPMGAATSGDGTRIRLSAVGQDFEGLNWDVWATTSGGKLVAVTFRSIPGGDNDDLAPAVAAAKSALSQG